MIDLLIEAFDTVRKCWSVDRVIADEALNVAFIQACRLLGSQEAALELNMRLLNARKRGLLRRPGTMRTSFSDLDEYSFASEIAIRSLERKHQTTLDRILCDPIYAGEFDSIAATIAPGFTSLQYRWAALRLRKSSRLKPELIGRIVPTSVFGPVSAAEIDPAEIPAKQGVYLIFGREKLLYIGEAESLRTRLKKHLDHSDNKQLARHLWKFGISELFLEYHVLPAGTPTRHRKAYELEMIRSRNPEFNVQR